MHPVQVPLLLANRALVLLAQVTCRTRARGIVVQYSCSLLEPPQGAPGLALAQLRLAEGEGYPRNLIYKLLARLEKPIFILHLQLAI